MAIGGQVKLADIGVEDIVREALRWSHPADRARRIATETLEQIVAAIEDGVVPPEGAVGKFVGDRARALLADPARAGRRPLKQGT
jgi:hypothetical protein